MVSKGRKSGGKPKAPPQPTDFQERLYAACKRIPKGKVTTYGTLAKVLESSARAVGQGNESSEVCRKRSMLSAEGVLFDGTKVAPASVVGLEEMAALAGPGARKQPGTAARKPSK